MKAFLFGLGLGIAAGVALAPASGDETRRQLQDRLTDLGGRMNDLGDRLGEIADEVRHRGPELIQRAQQQVSNLNERLRQNVSEHDPQPAGAEQEEHFGIQHPRGMSPRPSGTPAEERPEESIRGTAANHDSAIIDALNNASRDELTSVHGIGLVLAKRIIRHRPYESFDQVTEKGVLDADTLQQLKRELVDRKRAA